MDLFSLDHLQPFHSISSLKHLVTLALQIYLHTFAYLLVIFYYQHMIHFHLFTYSFPCLFGRLF